MRVRWLIPSGGRLLIVSAVLLVALLLYPVRSEITRVGIIAALASADCGLLLSLRRRRRVLLLVALPQVLLAIFLAIPGRSYDPKSLRAAYIAALARYEGTRYVWGGENHLGVDCSGLLRASLVEAHLLESARTLNPRLQRQGLWFWWNDASAREMSDGYRGHTSAVGKKTSLGAAGTDMQPGDFAVTADGSHVLAYIGDEQWIEADPYVNRVIRFKIGEQSQWWNARVIPGRWKSLEVPRAH